MVSRDSSTTRRALRPEACSELGLPTSRRCCGHRLDRRGDHRRGRGVVEVVSGTRHRVLKRTARGAAATHGRVLGGRGCAPTSHSCWVGREQRPGDLQVALVLGPLEPRLEVQRDLRVEVADPVVGHPGRLLERHDVLGPPLARPQPVLVRRDRDVDHPGRRGVPAQPDLATRRGTPPGTVSLSGRNVPPSLLHGVQSSPRCARKRGHVAGEDRDVDVLVLAPDARERLDRPAADQPPRPVEPGHQLGHAGRVERVPGAVPAEEVGVLRVLRQPPDLAHRPIIAQRGPPWRRTARWSRARRRRPSTTSVAARPGRPARGRSGSAPAGGRPAPA